ncbi:inovirus Gp2 family protein [Oxalobacteraceae bacterium OTU3CINTB1]|nr:inovirus Gp2 family protein [Oxalobacteraceae bacterium OTU3CINTB1]
MKTLKIKLLSDHTLTMEEIDCELVDEVDYFVTQEASGNLKINVDLQPELTISAIEDFVNAVAFPHDLSKHSSANISDYYPLINYFLNKFKPNYFYSPKVELFFEAMKSCHGSNIFYEFIPDRFYQKNSNQNVVVFRGLIETMKAIALSKPFQQKLKKWNANFKKSYSSAEKYVQSLFEKYSRLLVVRLDLGFRNTENAIDEGVSIEDAKKLLSRFLNAKRSNKIFDDVVGYIWKLEYGELKGYHYHLLIFLDGSRARKDISRGMLMGEYWLNLTQGNGVFYVSNFNKHCFEKLGLLGIGMISHSESDKIRNLHKILKYFFKTDQYLREKPSKRSRMYGKGETVQMNSLGRGRPRAKI